MEGSDFWWLITILLAVAFLGSTALEWRRLIFRDHLTISTNLFGTTFYSLVGLHASHVIVGLILLRVGLGLELAQTRDAGARRARRDALVVLAFCRWHMGHRFYRGLRHWSLATTRNGKANFTTKDQRGRAATKEKQDSPQRHRGRRVESFTLINSFLGVLRVSAVNSLWSEIVRTVMGKFARATKTLNDSSRKSTKFMVKTSGPSRPS